MMYKNLALGTLLTAPSPATTGTSLVLNSGEGAFFPQPSTDGNFFVTAFPPGVNPNMSNAEILEVTARTTDTFTIVREQRDTTAKSIDVDWIVLQGVYAEDMSNNNSFVINEVPSGTVNGTNAVFTTASNFISGSIQVYRDGQLMKGGGEDYTETDTDEITFVTAPQSGSVLLVSYQITGVGSGNADTVDGFHANSTPTANNIPVLDSIAHLPYADGWLPRPETWTRTGNHTFTVSGDLTSIYRKGTYIRYQDGGSDEYGVVGSSSHAGGTTTVNLIPNTDYEMAAATITDKFVSYIANPVGWPGWFNYTPTFGAGSTMTYTSVTNNFSKWFVTNNIISVSISASGTTGGTGSTEITATVPINYEALGASMFLPATVRDNTSGFSVGGAYAQILSGANLLNFRKVDASTFGLGTGRSIFTQGYYSF